EGDLRERKLRRAIAVEKAIGLLIRVRELRVAEAGEKRERAHDLEELAVTLLEGPRVLDADVSPTAWLAREADSAELGEHDRLIVLLDVIEDDHAAARTLATKELRDVLHRSVAFDEEGRPVRVVVDADDVRRDAFPAVVSDHRPRRIERSRQVIERLHAVPLSGAVGKIRDAPALVERHPSDDARVARVTLE